MKLPVPYIDQLVWTFIGPMGPALPESLLAYSLLGVDGGARFSPRLDLWVGDGDSSPIDIDSLHLFKLPPEKDLSDLAVALSFFESSLPYRFHFWGFLGGRKDHELLNFGESLTFLASHPNSQILFYNESEKVVCHLFGEGEWSFVHQGLYSLVTMKTTSVTMTGACKYQLEAGTKIPPLSSLGLSNEAFGEVKIKTKGPIMVMFSEDM